MQLVLPDGTVLPGEKALPEVLARLHRYGRLGAFFRIPGVPAFSRVLYRWFADHRYGIAKLLKRFPRPGGAKDRTWQRKTS
jgi:predicted DCC family thiol-disulfide oxidoreductase YuxK